ncbi:pentapeptide repeat-containing protein [Streptomyces sp. NPDC059262]|uniref:pentapeptide repeat-containing protein n=1 Tax=Streptomyces sp. NPDC059262 TaxID=3346797 RepID=UPI0036937DA9
MAHLTEADRDVYLDHLTPGADIDLRGTSVTEELLQDLLRALHDPIIDKPRFGSLDCHEVRFLGTVSFQGAQISGYASFHKAHFAGDALFKQVQFHFDAGFHGAQFFGDAEFQEAQFSGEAGFDGVRFFGAARFVAVRFFDYASFEAARVSGDAWFFTTRFSYQASFYRAQFSGDSWFYEVRFAEYARFCEARFAAMPQFGPVLCSKEVDLSGAVFEMPVTLDVAAREVRCIRTRWESTATLRLRYATVDLSDAVLSFPVAVTAHPAPFIVNNTPVDESLLEGAERGVRLTSEGVKSDLPRFVIARSWD